MSTHKLPRKERKELRRQEAEVRQAQYVARTTGRGGGRIQDTRSRFIQHPHHEVDFTAYDEKGYRRLGHQTLMLRHSLPTPTNLSLEDRLLAAIFNKPLSALS
jgi:hypothetical protein